MVEISQHNLPVGHIQRWSLHDNKAKETGSLIVHCCGFDCVPSDLSAFLAARTMRERHNLDCKRIRFFSGESTARWAMKTCPTRAETLDFHNQFWIFWGSVFLNIRPSLSFWTSNIDAGRPDGSLHTKRGRGLVRDPFSIIFARTVDDSLIFAMSILRNQHVRVYSSYQ